MGCCQIGGVLPYTVPWEGSEGLLAKECTGDGTEHILEATRGCHLQGRFESMWCSPTTRFWNGPGKVSALSHQKQGGPVTVTGINPPSVRLTLRESAAYQTTVMLMTVLDSLNKKKLELSSRQLPCTEITQLLTLFPELRTLKDLLIKDFKPSSSFFF